MNYSSMNGTIHHMIAFFLTFISLWIHFSVQKFQFNITFDGYNLFIITTCCIYSLHKYLWNFLFVALSGNKGAIIHTVTCKSIRFIFILIWWDFEFVAKAVVSDFCHAMGLELFIVNKILDWDCEKFMNSWLIKFYIIILIFQ